ncbi:MAG: hypothetical protein KDB14_06250 [Planctomycetales bacterium]|nr:hypothetical protein [Planctomycetales bacterium]
MTKKRIPIHLHFHHIELEDLPALARQHALWNGLRASDGASALHLHFHFENKRLANHEIDEPALLGMTPVATIGYDTQGAICVVGRVIDTGGIWAGAKAKVYATDPGDPSLLPIPSDAVPADFVQNSIGEGHYRFHTVSGASNDGSQNWVVVWILSTSGANIAALARKRRFEGQVSAINQCGYAAAALAAPLLKDEFPARWQLVLKDATQLLVYSACESTIDELVWQGGDWRLLVSRTAEGGYRGVLACDQGELAPLTYFAMQLSPNSLNQFRIPAHIQSEFGDTVWLGPGV